MNTYRTTERGRSLSLMKPLIVVALLCLSLRVAAETPKGAGGWQELSAPKGGALAELTRRPAAEIRPSASSEPPHTLRETIVNRLVVLGHGGASAVIASNIIQQLEGPGEYGLATVLAVTAYLGTALGSAIFHHWVDNYGRKDMGFGIGKVVKAFREHHSHSTLAEDSYSTVTQEAGKLLLPALVALGWASSEQVGLSPLLSLPLLVGLETTINGQWFHRLSHTPAKRLSRFVKSLQKRELIVSPKAHALHHLKKKHTVDGKTYQPFASHFDIVGPANAPLERLNFFRLWEAGRYKLEGKVPVLWQDSPEVKTEALELWRKSAIRRVAGRAVAGFKRRGARRHRRALRFRH